MSKDEFNSLRPGEQVEHLSGSGPYIVTANYGDRVTAVKTVDITNPCEWRIISSRTISFKGHAIEVNEARELYKYLNQYFSLHGVY